MHGPRFHSRLRHSIGNVRIPLGTGAGAFLLDARHAQVMVRYRDIARQSEPILRVMSAHATGIGTNPLEENLVCIGQVFQWVPYFVTPIVLQPSILWIPAQSRELSAHAVTGHIGGCLPGAGLVVRRRLWRARQ